jgi:hypothetical protein
MLRKPPWRDPMSVFVVVTTHTSDQCPSSNAKVWKLVTADPGATQQLFQKLGIKPLAGPFVSVDHRGFSVVEAASVDAIWDFAMQSGLAQWNSVDIVPVKSLETGLKEVASLEPLY